jgi:hypothetical protein
MVTISNIKNVVLKTNIFTLLLMLICQVLVYQKDHSLKKKSQTKNHAILTFKTR